jgi:drug/metabolite transporter (DMT)-like permease
MSRSSSLVSTAEGRNREAFHALDWALLAVAGGVWGSSFFFIAEALDSFQPMLITFLRMLLGFATLTCVPRAHAPIERQDWPKVALVAIVWMAFPLSMFPLAEQRVSSSIAGMLNGGTPIFVAVVATVLLRRPPGSRQRLGLAVGTAGIVLIGLPSLRHGSSSAIGVGLILLALCSYGLAINLVVPLQQKYGALAVLWRAAGIATLLLAPFGLVSLPSSSFSWHAVFANVALGVLGSAVAFVAAGTLAGRVGSTRASTTTYVIPVFALFLGAAVRDEKVALLSVIGCAIVLLGAFLASRSERAM